MTKILSLLSIFLFVGFIGIIGISHAGTDYMVGMRISDFENQKQNMLAARVSFTILEMVEIIPLVKAQTPNSAQALLLAKLQITASPQLTIEELAELYVILKKAGSTENVDSALAQVTAAINEADTLLVEWKAKALEMKIEADTLEGLIKVTLNP